MVFFTSFEELFKVQKAKAWGDNIVIDVNCQITWYISDSSKLSIDPNLHEMQSEDFLLNCKMHNGGSEILGKNVRLQHLKFDGTHMFYGLPMFHLFLLPFLQDVFFFSLPKKCGQQLFSPGYSSKPLEGYHRHSSGLTFRRQRISPRCWPVVVVDFSVIWGSFFVRMLCFRKKWGSLVALIIVKYILLYVYVHTSMYGRIHTY